MTPAQLSSGALTPREPTDQPVVSMAPAPDVPLNGPDVPLNGSDVPFNGEPLWSRKKKQASKFKKP